MLLLESRIWQGFPPHPGPRLGLCFVNLVQVLPSWAEREVRAGSVLRAACKVSWAARGWAVLILAGPERWAQIHKPELPLPGSSSLRWGE